MIIAFSGLPASGKSHISKYLAEQLNIPRISFGEYVVSKAKTLGLDTDRKTLQRLGQSLIEEDVEKFCDAVLKHNHISAMDSFILDGLRHWEVYEYFVSLVTPEKLILVYVDIKEDVLMKRLEERGELSLLESIGQEPTEVQVSTLIKENAVLIVNGHDDVDISVNSVISATKGIANRRGKAGSG